MSRQHSGIVDEQGNVIVGGKGCQVQRLQRGLYLIEFDQPFDGLPVTTATTFGHAWRCFDMSVSILDEISPYHVVILTSTPNQEEDCGFTFNIVGE